MEEEREAVADVVVDARLALPEHEWPAESAAVQRAVAAVQRARAARGACEMWTAAREADRAAEGVEAAREAQMALPNSVSRNTRLNLIARAALVARMAATAVRRRHRVAWRVAQREEVQTARRNYRDAVRAAWARPAGWASPSAVGFDAAATAAEDAAEEGDDAN